MFECAEEDCFLSVTMEALKLRTLQAYLLSSYKYLVSINLHLHLLLAYNILLYLFFLCSVL